MDISLDNDNFTFSKELNGQILAVVVGIETVAALLANSFVFIFTLFNMKVLKQPSNMFLTNLVLGNLIMTILYMIPVFVTTTIGEWVFGQTLEQRNASCQFAGFLYSHNVYLTSITFAIISVDRFLFIVKPLAHKTFMKTWVAVGIVIGAWILSALISTIPFTFGLKDQYVFDEFTATCGSAWISQTDYEIVFVLVVIFCVATITVTSVWTFCFTRRFIKRLQKNSVQEDVYNGKVRRVFGIFSVLLIATVCTYAPGVVVALVGFVIGQSNVPGVILTIIHIIFYLNFVLIPLIQLYFRKELNYYILACFRKLKQCCSLQNQSKSESSEVVATTATDIN